MEAQLQGMLTAMGLGFFAGVLTEAIGWVLVYRDPAFRRVHFESLRLWRQIQLQEDEGFQPQALADKKGKKEAKKMKMAVKGTSSALEKEFQKKSRAANALRTKGNMATGLLFMLLMPVAYGLFESVAVGRLPFTPISFVRYVTATNLPSTAAPEDCAATFFFTLCLMLTRSNVQRFLSFAQPGGLAGQGMLNANGGNSIGGASGWSLSPPS